MPGPTSRVMKMKVNIAAQKMSWMKKVMKMERILFGQRYNQMHESIIQLMNILLDALRIVNFFINNILTCMTCRLTCIC